MNDIDILNSLLEKKDLTIKNSQRFLDQIIEGNISPARIGAFLMGLRMKGESVDEIIGFINSMKRHMVSVVAPYAIDVCGTGGDGHGTFNISTAVAFVVAGSGVKIVKHGNRAASSQCGSADVLEKLGVTIQLSKSQAEEVAATIGMVFLFAPLFHPALKNIGSIRKELGIRTIFNFLGPFISPASVKRQLIGVPNVDIAEKLSHVGMKLGYEHLLIVTSEDGMDELTTSAKNVVIEIKNSEVTRFICDPQEYGFKKCSKKDFFGGTVEQNAIIMREILEGMKGARRDVVILNSAYALYVSGAVGDIPEGIRKAEHSIDSGAARGILNSLIRETQKYA